MNHALTIQDFKIPDDGDMEISWSSIEMLKCEDLHHIRSALIMLEREARKRGYVTYFYEDPNESIHRIKFQKL